MECRGALKPSLTVSALVCLALAVGPKAADPATVTSTFIVSTNVITTCVVSSGPLQFGNYQGTADTDATSTITLQCNNTAPYNIGLDAGTSAGATVTNRAMTGPLGSELLHYNLYRDAAQTLNWGNTVGTDTLAGIGAGTAQIITVYGIVPAGQGNRSGVYSDTITVTVTF